MSSYKDLPAYNDFLKKVSLDGGRVIAFCGAGLSKPNGLPDWKSLCANVLSDYRKEAEGYDPPEKQKILGACASAEKSKTLWESFSVIKNIRTQAVFEATIRRHLGKCEGMKPPIVYSRLWQMGIEGIITLNLDDFSQKSYSEVKPGGPLLSFCGFQITEHVDVLTRDIPFLCHLHGKVSEASSWVFSSDDHKRLKSVSGFREFFNACFLSASVVFVGISAEDIGAGGILSDLLMAVKRPRGRSIFR